MSGSEAGIASVFARLAPADGWVIWAQIGALVLSAVVAVAAGLIARRVEAHKIGLPKAIRTWPVELLILTAALWAAYLGFLGVEIDAEGLRLAAIVAAFFLASSVALRVIGRTVLGWIVVALAAVIGELEALRLTQSTIAALDAQGIFFGAVKVTPWFVIKTVAVVGGVFWVAQRFGDVLEKSLEGEQVLSRSGRVLFVKLARASLLVVALIFSLAFLGVNIATLAVLSGAVGLGLGFGLQKVVSNYMAGLILLMDKSIKPGDVIEVEFGGGQIRGEVTQLAGRFTAITLRTGTETLIPNEVLISSPVSNWSHTSRNVQIRIPVGVAYSTDVEKAIALCIEAALAAPRVIAIPRPVCLILGFGDSAVELDVRFWIADAERGVRNVSSGVYLEIWKRFHENGIEIPFPQRDIHIRSSFAVPAATEATDSAAVEPGRKARKG